MKVNLKGSVFVITGRLKEMSRAEAEDAIDEAGGRTDRTVTRKTDYVVAVDRSSYSYTKAKNMGIPILTEDDFKALIAGEAVEVEAIGEAGDRSVSELLGEVRSVMQGSPSAQMWSELIKLLDACRADDVDVLTDYIDSYIARWSDEQMRGLVGSNLNDVDEDWSRCLWRSSSSVAGELRVAPEHWVGEIQQGIDSPKYRIVRALDFTDTKMTSNAIVKILDHPSLVQIEILKLPFELVPGRKLIRVLCSHATVKHLQLGKIDEKTGGAFLEYGGEPTQLETFDMTRLDVKYGMRTADEICEFATAPYFSTVTSLKISGRRKHDFMFLDEMELGHVFQSVQDVHLDEGYDLVYFLKDMLETSWASERLKKITAKKIYYAADDAVLRGRSEFSSHGDDDADEEPPVGRSASESIAKRGAQRLGAMLHRILPSMHLLEHLDALTSDEEQKRARAPETMTMQQLWIDVLNSDFKGHLELLDLSGFDEHWGGQNITEELRAMLHRVLPTANLLAHLDTLILGEWNTDKLSEDLAKAFPDLTVQ